MLIQHRSKAHRRRIGAEFTPADIAGLSLWLRADSGTYQDNGMTTPAESDADPVGGWQDKSGNGFNFTSVADGDRPILKLAILNGQPVIRCVSSDYLKRAAVLAPSDTAGTLFIVAGTSGNTNNMLFTWGDEAGNSRYLSLSKNSAYGHALAVGQRNADTKDVIYGTTALNDGTARCLVVKSSGTAYTFYVNGASEALSAGSGANNGDWIADVTGLDNTVIGTWVYSSVYPNYWDGDIAEIIYYSSALSDADRQRVEAYLSARYGLGF